jgi:hypothetical protein
MNKDELTVNAFWKDTFDYGAYKESTDWRKNVVTFSGHSIITGLLANDSSISPIEFIAQGSGSSDWDDSTPEPNLSQSTLVSEIDRRSPDSISYVDSQNNEVSEPTGQIKIETTYPNNDPLNGETIREQGLFGGQDVTTDQNSGDIFNVFNHEKIEKDDSFSLTRKVFIDIS